MSFSAPLLDCDEIARRICAGADGVADSLTPGSGGGQGSLHPLPLRRLRPAAVLVPIVVHAEGLTVLLTQRAAHLTAHPGQISFPGGRLESDDEGIEAAALREAWEEIGLTADQVRLSGRLERCQTSSGFEVSPVVGFVNPPLNLTPDPREVSEIFEIPLSFILNPSNYLCHSKAWQDRVRWYYTLSFAGWTIWGATASMLMNLSRVLRAPPPRN